MTRASKLLRWFVEQDDDLNKKGVKVKDYINKEKQDAKNRGEITDDNPDIIDSDDDDQEKSDKVLHASDSTSGLTCDNTIKKYAFPTKRVKDDN